MHLRRTCATSLGKGRFEVTSSALCGPWHELWALTCLWPRNRLLSRCYGLWAWTLVVGHDMNSGAWYEVWAVPWINQSPGGTKPCPHSSVVWQVYYSGVWWCRQVWKLEVFSDILESFFFFWFGQHWRYDREQQICSAHSEKRVSCSDYKIKHQMKCVRRNIKGGSEWDI